MRAYIALDQAEGRKFMPKVQNLFFGPLTEDAFFVEPWANREIRDCAEFRLNTGGDGSDEVLVFVTDKELIDFLTAATGEIYLYGAYNQINVCQMRACGTVKIATDYPETKAIKGRLRTAIQYRVRSMLNKLDEAEAKVRYAMLDHGLLFCFRINSYAYQMYERG